jgi:tetratricopeptide (TPR) repeat protein
VLHEHKVAAPATAGLENLATRKTARLSKIDGRRPSRLKAYEGGHVSPTWISISRKSLAFAVLLGLLTAARQRSPVPTSERVRPSASSLRPDESRSLCLAEPGAGVDVRRISAAAALARTRGGPGDWVKTGHEWVRRARVASDPGFYVNANACASLALAVDQDFTPALALRGLALMNDHKFGEARALAEEVIRTNPEDALALGLLSDALLELGHYDESADAARRQMDAGSSIGAQARASYLRWLRGDTHRAKLLIKDALMGMDARDPEPAAWTLVEAAGIFWHEGEDAEADALYAEALDWLPDYPRALVGRSRIALARRDPRHAIPALEKAYAARPLVETGWLLGDARAMAGDPEGARRAYDDTVRIGRRGDRLTLAYFYAVKNRDVDEALQLVEEERRSRGGVYVEDVYAWVLYRAGRFPEARRASDRASQLGTRDARLLYHAGAIRVAAGDAAGLELIERALALNPGFDVTGSAEALSLLAKPAAS